jgi:hypothetical protein
VADQDGYAALTEELMKPNPVKERRFLVRVTVEEYVQRERGPWHLQTTHKSALKVTGETLDGALAAFAEIAHDKTGLVGQED